MRDERRVVLITGATSGVGFETVKLLTETDLSIIAVGRNENRIRRAHAMLRSGGATPDITYLTADLSSLRAVEELAQAVAALVQKRTTGKLYALVNNAAIVSDRHITTGDGLELQFVVNHLAPFLLIHRLLPLLLDAHEARIINVTSGSHRNGTIHWDNLNLRRGYGPLRAYAQSKLANLLTTYELARRLNGTADLRCYAFDPGLVDTAIGQKDTTGLTRWIWSVRRRYGRTPGVPASQLVALLMRSEQHRDEPLYRGVDSRARPARRALDREVAARIWCVSERICGIEPNEPLSIGSPASASKGCFA